MTVPWIFTRSGRPIFVDTSAWYAVAWREDPHSETAGPTWERLLASHRPIVTSNHVIGESYTLIRARHGYQWASAFLDRLDRTVRLMREHLSSEIETQAYSILRQYRDHDFSFVDGTSFAFMRANGITEAFAFDAHFAVAGFTRIPVDRPLG